MKSVLLKDLCRFLDEKLKIDSYTNDSSNNGLQIEGCPQISKALFAVDACIELFNYAIENNFQFIFVHHGLSWGEGVKRITGLNAKRFSVLIKNEVSLYAAHLPLDAHPELSHNAKIAEFFPFLQCFHATNLAESTLGVVGILKEPLTAEKICKILDKNLQTKSKVVIKGRKKIEKIAIIAGAGGKIPFLEWYNSDIDCYITGEIKHTHYHLAKESGLTVITAGHYATEVPGVIATMKIVQEKFPIYCEFRNLPTGM